MQFIAISSQNATKIGPEGGFVKMFSNFVKMLLKNVKMF